MRGYRPSFSGYAWGQAWLVAWVLLASFALGHTGLAGLMEQGLHATAGACAGEHAGGPQNGCEGGCDGGCAEAHGDAHDSSGGGCEERCPGDAPDGTCPPQCDDCRCCAGASVLLVPGLHVMSLPVQVSIVRPPVSDHPSFPTHQRIFRPPRSVPAC